MGLYLAELAPPTAYALDPIQAGHLLVHYKHELRWAKPCMRFGVFELPDLAWVKRNYDKYKVWVDFEDQRVALQTQESLIWVGFLPTGNPYPEPAADIEAGYPEVLVEEIGSWRIVRTSKGAEEKFQLFQLDPDGTPHAVLECDGKSSVKLLQEKCDIVAPKGATVTVLDGTVNVVAQKGATIGTPDGTVTFNAQKGFIVSTPDGAIKFGGSGANEPFIMGNVWKTKMDALVNAIKAANVVTSMGPSSPISGGPTSAQITPAQNALSEALSEFIFGKKTKA